MVKTAITSSAKQAAAFIRRGDIAAFPTETVYGLGADAFDQRAVKKIFSAKGRPADNPLIVHIHSKGQVSLLASRVTPPAKRLIRAFFPGPLSIVLKKKKSVPSATTAGLPTVCVRMPSSQAARRFIRACGVPIAAPSANISGSPSPTTWQHVLQDMGGKIPVILKGPPSRHGLESTVIDCAHNPPRLLRAGSLPLEKIVKVLGAVQLGASGRPLSPGMKYRHYAPSAKVVIVSSRAAVPPHPNNSAYIGLDAPPAKTFSLRPKNSAQYARALFAFLRRCDAKKITTIYAQSVPERGMGRAIMERLKKASMR